MNNSNLSPSTFKTSKKSGGICTYQVEGQTLLLNVRVLQAHRDRHYKTQGNISEHGPHELRSSSNQCQLIWAVILIALSGLRGPRFSWLLAETDRILSTVCDHLK